MAPFYEEHPQGGERQGYRGYEQRDVERELVGHFGFVLRVAMAARRLKASRKSPARSGANRFQIRTARSPFFKGGEFTRLFVAWVCRPGGQGKYFNALSASACESRPAFTASPIAARASPLHRSP
ncbi:hypothetical protein [Lysobacter gummosus]|uniref:hypothetical protein n=1 Tax=Lysobacter gummosus TaxID=262324 RepID=UPI003628E224